VSRIPIRLRLTLVFALAMAVVLAGVGLLVYIRVGDALLSSVDQTLRSQGREAQGRGPETHALVDQDAAGGTTLAEVLNSAGRVLRSSPAGLPPLVRRGVAAPTLRSVNLARPRGHWRVYALPVSGGETIALARSLEARHATLERLFRELVLAGSIGLLLAAGIGYAVAAGALRPVEAMRRRAAAVTASSGTRLPVPPSRDEIARLATTLNEMLGRLESAFEHERRFLADASHELRTPLALLRAELELALRRPRTAAELELAVRSAAEETERLTRLAEDLLFIARADQGALPIRTQILPVADVLETVVERFSARSAELGRTIGVDASDLEVEADPERLDQAISGLVDNALRHGAGEIVLSARPAADGSVEIHVADEGDGFPAEFRARAFDRFSRADEARSRGGSGLGLSVVAVIAAAHGGRAGIGDGADVWLSLPRAGVRSRERALT
jgi:two-component system OmpR family sensor kinase